MLDARYVADHLDEVRAQLARRGPEFANALDGVVTLVSARRELTRTTELAQAERNTASEAMAKLAKSGDKAGIAARREELKALSERVKGLETELAGIEGEIEDKLLGIPNIPHPTVPAGTTEAQNTVVRTWGIAPSFDFEPTPHYELGEKLGILDFERAAKLSGARFSVLWGAGARLERALQTFMLDLHTLEHGYTEVYPPYLVKAEALRSQ
jgi:seryl-tRNA synthetase